MKTYKRVLTIAGSDSGGGAGIQADIKTISACGCYAASAITAITVQNTVGVRAVQDLPVAIVRGQIDAVVSDIGVDAVKIGMLSSSEIIKGIKEELLAHKLTNVVLDPVMVSTSGHKLLQDDAIDTLKNELLPCARVITPNIPEAEILLGKKIEMQNQLPEYARELAKMYGTSVLLKAGHLTENELVDVFYNAETDETIFLKSPRQYTKNTHGTGCTLSSAFASFLAKGYSLNDAARNAKDYISQAITAGADYEIGHGHGPVCHFWQWWGK
jgi:hydroxymethylpyrimidine/phosphomethylpyrimidine kinase